MIALLDEHYDELWVGGKASYKLGGIIEDGGELVIYAPHLKGISTTHGRLIEKYGYAPLETVREMVEGSDELRANLCVAAHLAHVSYGSRVGTDGRIAPRYRITLASGISEEVCARVKLGYQSLAIGRSRGRAPRSRHARRRARRPRSVPGRTGSLIPDRYSKRSSESLQEIGDQEQFQKQFP